MPSPERSDNDIVAAARKQASAKHRGGSPAGGKAGGSSSDDDGRGRRRRRLRSQAGSPLKLLAGIGDPGSSTTAGSVGSSPALSRSTCRSGEDFSFRPPGRRSGRNSEAVALAGLSLFLKERFGSLHEAFVQMDFHRDGRISCLEFQEVLSGQERYCGLHEARELFCMLARGSDGWLRWDNFKAFLGSAHHTPESAGAYSGAGAPRDASSTAGVGRSFDAFKHELWALPSCADAGGSHGTGPLAQRKPGCDEADEVDTTMQSLCRQLGQISVVRSCARTDPERCPPLALYALARSFQQLQVHAAAAKLWSPLPRPCLHGMSPWSRGAVAAVLECGNRSCCLALAIAAPRLDGTQWQVTLLQQLAQRMLS